ncbi:hypothetical protein NA57DRAFT_16470, partial [Rhizodiscina lignyota]
DPDKWATIISKQKEFRLFSLRTAPEAFSSTFARESAFTPDVWEDRARNPLASTIVAVALDDDESATQDDVDILVKGKFVGITVLLGPKEESFAQASKSPWETMKVESKNSDTNDINRALYCHMNAVFVDPAYKGLGIAKSLIDEAIVLGEVRSIDRGADAVGFTILVEKENIAATKLYQKCHFNIVGEETIKSPRKEKADGTPIPE